MSNGQDRGTLEILLAEQISVFDLQALLAGIHKVYFYTLWLDLAELAQPGQVFPDFYMPNPDEELWISVLEIGTPNLLTLKGKRKNLTAVAVFLTTVLGAPIAGTEAWKNYAEAQKAFVESDLHRVEIIDKAAKLYEGGKISEDALRRKLALPDELVDSIVATHAIVPKQVIQVIPANVSEPNVSGAHQSVISATVPQKVQVAVADLGKPESAPAVRDYLQAQNTFVTRRDAASQQELQRAYTRLAAALAPITDDEIHQLIERLLSEG
jgi:hypothetical protein